MAGFVNPIGPGLTGERIDMGVDYGGRGPLFALGAGTITSIFNKGWPGGTFIGLHLDSGQFVYYAEDIVPHVRVGDKVQAGTLLGTASGGSSGIEVGWAAPPGTGDTMAAITGQSRKGQSQGDPGKYTTGYGISMNNLIKSLGGPGGTITPGGIQGSVPNITGVPGTATAASSGSMIPPGCIPGTGLIVMVHCAIIRRRKR